MAGEQRVRLSERDAMEMGIRCPNCGTYTSFGDILATGQCRGMGCVSGLELELVISE
ncbi:hypothetical protein KU306_05540 [Haloferax larsenii]|uniref:Small CPxCG-related zinc finger protein n=1 Tax=Haloferax larsenii TaxID=302484 RepID=A0ABY5RG36_HALLR|nr:hypothetical protein [Haloferax larsenii]UVE51342.1 hypothetical protein KU306_05540 [Haloferax larsenii]